MWQSSVAWRHKSHRRIAGLAVFVGLAGLAGRVAAQDPAGVPNRDAAVEMRKQYLLDLDTLQTKFLALAEAIPADKYSWRPAPGVRSVGEVFMHVASEYYVYTPLTFGATPSPVVTRSKEGMQKFEAMSTKEDVLKHLKEGFQYATTAVNGVDPATLVGKRKVFGGDYNIVELSLGMADDMHEHLGQLIGYARMNGVKPPWTK